MVTLANLRYWALGFYSGLSALVIFKDIVSTPEGIAVLLAPIAGAIVADVVKHRNEV